MQGLIHVFHKEDYDLKFTNIWVFLKIYQILNKNVCSLLNHSCMYQSVQAAAAELVST